MTPFIQSLIDATSAGAIYALAALGISLIFGVLGLANFAHAEIITASGYTLIFTWRFGPAISILASVVVAILLAMLMDLVVFARFRRADPATLLIASFAVSILLQRVYDGLFTSNVKTYAVAAELSHSVRIAGLRLNLLSLTSIVLAVILLILLQLFLKKSSLGLQVQAAASDFTTARILGVRSGRVIGITFALSGVLAAAVAFILTAQSGAVSPSFGTQVTLMGLIGAVIGGLGKLNGALLGGFAVGFALSQLTTWLPGDANDFRIAFVYLLVILVLVFRPNGLLIRRGTGVRA
jgi:branched-chain amino acid transport system permease protein